MKVVSLVLILFIDLFAYTDLGKWGQMYEIREHIKWKKKDRTKQIEDKFKRALKDALISKEKLRTCLADRTWLFDPTVVLKKAIVMPKYNINIPAGSKFNPLEYTTMTKYLILIDGSDKNQIALANFYKNVAMIIIFNAGVDVIKPTSTSEIYIATKSFVKTFKPKCLPSIYTQKDKEFIVKEINIKNLIKEEE